MVKLRVVVPASRVRFSLVAPRAKDFLREVFCVVLCTPMKGLIAGIILILVIGIGGFLYRNTFEHPYIAPPAPEACSTETKLCPDGTAVTREGPSCAFRSCGLPNAEDTAVGIGFVIPPGYTANADAIGADETLRAVFDKPSKGTVPHSIIVRRYMIETGKTATDTILAHTMYESSGNLAQSMKEFTSKTFNEKTFSCVTLERFEGQIHSACYYPRITDVLRFEVLEKDVVRWTDPKLKVDSLPEHTAFYTMLGTLQVNP